MWRMEDGSSTALDITHDPDGGCDCEVLAAELRASRDQRIKTSSEPHICSSTRVNGEADGRGDLHALQSTYRAPALSVMPANTCTTMDLWGIVNRALKSGQSRFF